MKDDFRPLVSCVVTIYNAEKHLDQTVGSLLAQTYDNVEIILVDDWSNDKSWAMCRKFAKKHDNVFVYRTDEKAGAPLRAREKGINKSRGDWITFIDGDDFVSPHYIEHLLEVTHSGTYDIAVTGYSWFHPDAKAEEFLWNDYSQTTKERLETFYEHFLGQNDYTDPTDTCGQNLVRASVAKKTDLSKYPSTVWAEDTLMALAFLSNSENGVNFVDHHDFFWRQTPGSGSNGGFSSTANKPAFFRACYEIFNKKGLLPLVSIVVSIFNVEKYLDACVNSLLTQTYPNLEIILVDDKSTDKSGRMADEYLEKDGRVRVIHKPENEGLNMARKTGFDASHGEYITFLDSDDFFHEDNVADSLRALLNNKADVSIYATKEFNDRDTKDALAVDNSANIEEKLIVNKKLIAQYAFCGDGNLLDIKHMTVWGKLFSRNLLEHTDWKASNYRAYEDSFWTPQALLKSKRIVLVSSYLMYYRRNLAYGTLGNNLGNRLTGNSINGKAVGYIEYVDLLESFYYKLAREHGFESKLDEQIHRYMLLSKTWRIDNLVGAGLLESENNLELVVDALPQYIEAKNKHIHNLDENIEYLKQSIVDIDRHLTNLRTDNERLNQTIGELMGVKRSAKLLAGNIKRKIFGSR
jgi:glycosyltransferase involved in cell wall biosynthesis